MLPVKCSQCDEETGYFYILEKNGQLKSGVCPKCKDKLEKQGWKVIGHGLL